MGTREAWFDAMEAHLEHERIGDQGSGQKPMTQTQYNKFHFKENHAIWRTLNDACNNAQGVLTALDQAGYAIVPKEPTQAMLDAGYKAMFDFNMEHSGARLYPAPSPEETKLIYQAIARIWLEEGK